MGSARRPQSTTSTTQEAEPGVAASPIPKSPHQKRLRRMTDPELRVYADDLIRETARRKALLERLAVAS